MPVTPSTCASAGWTSSSTDIINRLGVSRDRAYKLKQRLRNQLGELVLDELTITASTSQQLAQTILSLMVIVWGRTINHRPRRDRGERTRAELLEDKPTAEEFGQAQTTLEQLAKRQEQARKTRAARQDPIVRG